MNDNKSDPPGLAIWWLLHAWPGRDNEALTGDLIERFHEGQTRGWFWRQVMIAFIVSGLREMRHHWPYFCYAIAGTAGIWLFDDVPAVRKVPGLLHWNELPWPWSQLAAELSRPALFALATLAILAAGLLIERRFRWISLIRTGVLNLALIAFGHYSIDLFPWLLRPMPGDQNHKFLIIPFIAILGLSFSTFLVSAWLGCMESTRKPPLVV
jgi:hypothetical protein